MLRSHCEYLVTARSNLRATNLLVRKKTFHQLDDLPLLRQRASNFDQLHPYPSVDNYGGTILKPSMGVRTKYYKLYISSSCYNKWFIFSLCYIDGNSFRFPFFSPLSFVLLPSQGFISIFTPLFSRLKTVESKKMSGQSEMCQRSIAFALIPPPQCRTSQ